MGRPLFKNLKKKQTGAKRGDGSSLVRVFGYRVGKLVAECRGGKSVQRGPTADAQTLRRNS